MALVTVVIVGLELFSDTGVRGAIIQNARGDDPAFLDTAWTVQAIRGLVLWLATLALAHPVALLYDEPLLTQILPVAGLSLAITGLQPTAVHSANRHLALGRLVRILLGSQAVSLIVMAILAWQLRSVWALAIGTVIGAIILTAAYHLLLDGRRDRPRLERAALGQIFHFGKWIFLSTAGTFLVTQGDRAILGLHVPLDVLGVYTVGFFLASVPAMLAMQMQQRVVLPLYRMRPAAESPANRAAIFRTRRLIALGLVAGAGLLAFAGPVLIAVLYDDRYAAAGAMITVHALAAVPAICIQSVGVGLIGMQDTRRNFFFTGALALVQTGLLLLFVPLFGVPAALLAPGAAVLACYPLLRILGRRYQLCDPLQEIGLTLAGSALVAAAWAVHWDGVLAVLRG